MERGVMCFTLRLLYMTADSFNMCPPYRSLRVPLHVMLLLLWSFHYSFTAALPSLRCPAPISVYRGTDRTPSYTGVHELSRIAKRNLLRRISLLSVSRIDLEPHFCRSALSRIKVIISFFTNQSHKSKSISQSSPIEVTNRSQKPRGRKSDSRIKVTNQQLHPYPLPTPL